MFARSRLDPVLPIKLRLAHFIGQAMRRELRSLLNPPPPRGCSKDTTYEHRAALFSQAYTYVQFKGKGRGLAANDKNLATLVSRAMQALYNYFGLEVLMRGEPEALLAAIPPVFCASEASMKDIAPVPAAAMANDQLEPDDLADVLHDIDQATAFVSAVDACRFLVDLFSIERVQNEVERRGGWGQLQTYAALSWQYELYESIAEDAHFVLLANAATLFDRFPAYRSILLSREADCLQSLMELSKRKRLTTKSQMLLQQYPQIQLMQDRLEQGRDRVKLFPRVLPV